MAIKVRLLRRKPAIFFIRHAELGSASTTRLALMALDERLPLKLEAALAPPQAHMLLTAPAFDL